MTEQDVREILRLAGMDMSDALSHSGTGRRLMLGRIGQEAIRSIVLRHHADLEFALTLTLAHSLLRASGSLGTADDTTAVTLELAALLERKLGVTGAAEMARLMGAISAEQRSIVLELNALRNKYAHMENPSTRDGLSLRYRGRRLEEPTNLRRLVHDVASVRSKLGELLRTDEVDDADAAD
jgi:hypothetical protein